MTQLLDSYMMMMRRRRRTRRRRRKKRRRKKRRRRRLVNRHQRGRPLAQESAVSLSRLGSIPGPSIWDLWWTQRHCDRFSS